MKHATVKTLKSLVKSKCKGVSPPAHFNKLKKRELQEYLGYFGEEKSCPDWNSLVCAPKSSVYNPRTGRCVKKSAAIGQRMAADLSPYKRGKAPKKKSPSCGKKKKSPSPCRKSKSKSPSSCGSTKSKSPGRKKSKSPSRYNKSDTVLAISMYDLQRAIGGLKPPKRVASPKRKRSKSKSPLKAITNSLLAKMYMYSH